MVDELSSPHRRKIDRRKPPKIGCKAGEQHSAQLILPRASLAVFFMFIDLLRY
jgi:hypothetical protein